MLQQTRVAAVLPYYQRFLAHFPTPEHLAKAPEQQVLALWAGLGYYSRARNLQKAAAVIVEAGGFPSTWEGIRALPGVGDYTAAAIGSICFNIPRVVVDGNVLRVMSRLEGDTGDIGAVSTRERLRVAAQKLLDRRRPADFNQALMELGATVCLPKKPLCLLCPLVGSCAARERGVEGQLPVKLGKPARMAEEKVLLIIERGGKVALRQREATEKRMAGFWELPEWSGLESRESVESGEKLGEFSHSITRHDYVIEVRRGSTLRPMRGWLWKSRAELAHLPLSTMTRKALSLAGLVGSQYRD